MLVLHPGTLTRRYIDGERARFVSPLALFLFTVFLMFATISAVGPGDLGKGMSGAQKKMAEAQAQARDAVTQLDRRRAVAAATGQPTAAIDQQRDKAHKGEQALDKVAMQFEVTPHDTVTVTSKWGWLKHALVDKLQENPSLAIYKLQSSAYKYSWLLIPLSTPFVALLFLWRRGFGLYDHAIFVTYWLSFMTLMVIALTLLGLIGLTGALIVLAALLAPPVHMFAQLRGTYGLRKRSALWRTAGLLVFAFVALLAFAVLLTVHEFAG